jgi:hypothetical protein
MIGLPTQVPVESMTSWPAMLTEAGLMGRLAVTPPTPTGRTGDSA